MRSAVAKFWRPVLTGVLVIGFFYAVPLEPGVSGPQLVFRVVVTFGAGLLVTWLIFRQLAHQVADPDEAPLAGLLTALICGVAFFALADYITAISGPNQFADLRTKTDALYFALATLTTVGQLSVGPAEPVRLPAFHDLPVADDDRVLVQAVRRGEVDTEVAQFGDGTVAQQQGVRDRVEVAGAHHLPAVVDEIGVLHRRP